MPSMERKEYNSMNLTNDADKLACISYDPLLERVFRATLPLTDASLKYNERRT